ncbi:aminoglycoside phosphotransferase family protein [Microbulbifer sp. 2205BS26-8]|uniref:aminoglycoside phosphotransferase family protein n=1 Tax=Microbulbifer sp. 2205BS26-8 TaxID=3064386 RepID=UPI00273EFCAD|nr:phosphotransferase [Microbulbifer sp. 2205BS26-8]MDP5208793.1 phosphotransferase [Microbulbifer sp. 2205BS26-8]
MKKRLAGGMEEGYVVRDDLRREQLARWVGRALEMDRAAALFDLAGDAGFRRYFRTGTEPRLVAVDSPPQRTNPARFVALADYLRRNGIHTPMVIAADTAKGFLLLEDLGDIQLFCALNKDSVEGLYAEILSELLCLQQIPREEALLPAYSRELLLAEMRIMPEWLAGKMLGYSLSEPEVQLLEMTFQLLLESAAEQPQTLVHRDYHSRNLMVRGGQRPGVMDFQDAVWGPVTYDLASLLRDCYIRWPRERVVRWALAYAATAESAGILEPVAQERFIRWFDWMGLQRHIKVLGLFPRLLLRDGKRGYLQNLPLVIRYVLEISERYPELKPFGEWFGSELLPLIERQPWYSDYRMAGS